jgi:hypothetical protein
MALSSTDPVIARSLWLQSRSTRRKSRRAQWRRDWTPIWFVLLFMSLLTLFAVMMLSNDAVERVEQPAYNGRISQPTPVLGALAEP